MRRFLRRIAAFLGASRAEVDLEREVAGHLAILEDDFRRRGLTDDDARRAARRALGGVDRAKELHRDARSFPWLEDLRRDTIYAMRMLARAKGFAATVVFTLGVGAGTATAMFSVLNAVLIRPRPFPDADRLVYVGVSNARFADAFAAFGGGVGFAPSNADFADLEHETTSFSGLMAFSAGVTNVTGDGLAELVSGSRVSGRYFEVLGVPALLGRTLGPDDDRATSTPAAVISHRVWASWFQKAPDTLGRFINVDGKRHRIVGVMPSRFMYASLDPTIDAEAPSDVWTAMRLTPAERRERDFSDNSATIGRRRDGVSFEQARAETAGIIARLDGLRSEEWRGWYATMDWVGESSIREIRRPMWLLFGAVSLLLVAACANVAHLFLTRAIGRTHELEVRAALGAGGGRLARQLMTEAGLLAIGSSAVGLLVAYGGVELLPLFETTGVPRLDEVSMDWRVFSFSALVCALTAVGFGLLPAIEASRRAGSPSPKTIASPPRGRALVVCQVAVALVLLTGGSLLVESYRRVQRLDRGFSARALTMSIALTDAYTNQPEKRRRFQTRLLDSIRAIPGVETVGIVNTLPLSQSGAMSTLEIAGQAALGNEMVDTRTVMGDYFRAIGMTLVGGRWLTDTDAEREAKVILVNRAFERRYFPNSGAIGRQVRASTPDWMTIVGVVTDVRHDNLEDAPRPQVYTATVHPLDSLYVVVRSHQAAPAMVAAMRNVIREIDPSLAPGGARTMGDRVSSAMSLRRFQTSALGAFAVAAVAIATIGLYGVIAYSVRQRAREIGVRLALGAGARTILLMVLAQGAGLTFAGVVLGAFAYWFVAGVLTSMLYDVAETDPAVLGSVAGLIWAVGLLASYIPARRATRIDPATTLRSESY